MKHWPLIIALFLVPFTGNTAPTDHVGRTLPYLQLVTGETFRQAKIVAADKDGITIESDGTRRTLSRFALSVDAQAALGFPYEPDKQPIPGVFRIVQAGKGRYLVRLHTPAPSAGSFQALNNQIFNRPSANLEGSDGEQLFLLKGEPSQPIADGELLMGSYVTLDETETFESVAGSDVTVRVLILLTGKRFAR